MPKNKQKRMCAICGQKESNPNSYAPCNLVDTMRVKHCCFTCAFWEEHIMLYSEQNIVCEGTLYYLGGEEDFGGFRGFGGQSFVFRMLTDGRIITSTNLWCNGAIPEQFRDRLPDTVVRC